MPAIEELAIVNYCHKNCQPLKNIMRLPREAAFALAAEMARQNPDATAFGRFADFQFYYPERLEVDRRLHERFLALGGAPLFEHPLSFVLMGSRMLENWFGQGIATRFLLGGIPPERLSFTYGDSMTVSKRRGGFTMLTKAMLLDRLAAYAGPEAFLREVEREYKYMEVQFWGSVQELGTPL